MSDLREQTEALLEAMGWKRHEAQGLGYLWSDDGTAYQSIDKLESFTGVFEHIIPWATARGWSVDIMRVRTGFTRDERDNCWVDVEGDDGEHEAVDVKLDLNWLPGEPDRTVEAIVSALYAALTGERDGC